MTQFYADFANAHVWQFSENCVVTNFIEKNAVTGYLISLQKFEEVYFYTLDFATFQLDVFYSYFVLEILKYKFS